jgi:hypothetical protein
VGHEMTPAMHRATEFIVRLVADPQVDARIHADPRLHEIWARPAVQQYLQRLRQMHGGAVPVAVPPRHDHEQDG